VALEHIKELLQLVEILNRDHELTSEEARKVLLGDFGHSDAAAS